MSTCNYCGTPILANSTFCNSCGRPYNPVPPAAILAAPAGTQRALIGPTPWYQAFFGLFIIIIGAVFASINSFFAPISAIMILAGIVLFILGVMGKPIFAQQVVYQTSQPAPTPYQSGFMKRCARCGALIPSFALICEKCGANQ